MLRGTARVVGTVLLAGTMAAGFVYLFAGALALAY
jgi:hypothetical protein